MSLLSLGGDLSCGMYKYKHTHELTHTLSLSHTHTEAKTHECTQKMSSPFPLFSFF